MIVKMQKVTILVSDKHSDDALRKLREFGVVHIEHIQEPHAHGISHLEKEIENVESALFTIGGLGLEQKSLSEKSGEADVNLRVRETISLMRDKQSQLLRAEELKKEAVWFKEWGDVSNSSLEELKGVGVFIKLYICSKRLLKAASKDKSRSLAAQAQDKIIQTLKEKEGNVYLALISKLEGDSLNLPEVEVPDKSLHSLVKEQETVGRKLKDINKKLISLSQYADCFIEHKKDLVKKLKFYQVKFGMGREEGFCYLEGFCPRNQAASLKGIAGRQGWGFLSRKPEDSCNVPTLLKNPKWVEIIKPVFNFMGTLPGYKEYDISFWFLLFFSLFFAILIGDGGYGLLFLAAALIARKKFKNTDNAPFFLLYVLSIATIIWGAVTGTWFGAEKIAQLPFFNLFVVNKINSFVSTNQGFMMYLCFLLGVIHLTIAHGIIAVKFINSLIALAQLGWICILWGLFFIASKLILDKPLPTILPVLLAAGTGLVILFSNPQRNIFKGWLTSLGDFPLKVISSFSDIVSYLRLFAVGYATVAVAMTFNHMAFACGFNSILRGLITAVILFFGHTLNIILGLMAVIVHGVRLNMLEFSGHLNMEWSGREYRPFRE